jgi:hypothetical protein
MMKPTRMIFVFALAGISLFSSLAFSQMNHLSCTLSTSQRPDDRPESITFDESRGTVIWNGTEGGNITITNDQIKFETHGGTAAGREQNGTDNTIERTTGHWTQRDWAFDYAPSPIGNHWYIRTRTLTCKVAEK